MNYHNVTESHKVLRIPLTLRYRVKQTVQVGPASVEDKNMMRGKKSHDHLICL